MAAAELRPMRAPDVAPAAEIMTRGDWGDRTTFLDWAVGHPACHPFVAEEASRIVGTGVATAYGDVGWVGTIFVDAAARGRGLGRALTRAVVEDLESRGCRTLLLIATSHGRPLYEREGFSVLTEHHRFSTDGLAGNASEVRARVRPFDAGSMDAILELDREINGGDRSSVLRSLANPEAIQVSVDEGGAVRGFLVRGPWGGGGLVAPDPDDAIALLEWRRLRAGPDARVATGMPSLNVDGRERLRAAGWAEEPGGTRMVRGPAPNWRPVAVWGQINGALG